MIKMGRWHKPDKRAKGWIKVIDPKPVWEVEIRESGKDPYTIFVGTEKAEEYFKAGFPVKMRTTAGELKQMED